MKNLYVKSLTACLLAVVMLLCNASLALAEGEGTGDVLGEPNAKSFFKYTVDTPDYVKGGYIEVTVKATGIKVAGGAVIAFLKLCYDGTKVEPIIKNNDTSDNKEMDSFIVKPIENWEIVGTLDEDECCYNLAVCTAYRDTAFADGSIELKIPFNVKSDAAGDLLFYIPHSSVRARNYDMVSFTGSGAYSVSNPASGIAYERYADGTCSVFGIGTFADDNLVIPAEAPSGEIVTSIRQNAFADGNSLVSVFIPDSVRTIGENAFSGCNSLKTLYCAGASAQSDWDEAWAAGLPADCETVNRLILSDIDASGEVDALDLIMAAQSLADAIQFNELQQTAADYDASGVFDAADLISLAQYLAGVI